MTPPPSLRAWPRGASSVPVRGPTGTSFSPELLVPVGEPGLKAPTNRDNRGVCPLVDVKAAAASGKQPGRCRLHVRGIDIVGPAGEQPDAIISNSVTTSTRLLASSLTASSPTP